MRIKRKPRYTEANVPLNNYPENWGKIREQVIKKRGTLCFKCKVDMKQKMEGLHVHHKNRRKDDNDPENLQLLCALCHKNIHKTMFVDKDIEDFIIRNRKMTHLKQ